jgi:HK97 family phage portal protein
MIAPRTEQREIVSVDDYITALNQFAYNGFSYGFGQYGTSTQQTLAATPVEPIPNDFRAYALAHRTNGVIFACMSVRMSVFSSIRLQWQRQNSDGKPTKLFGTNALEVFENPWPGATTQDLLVRMIQDADLCGNSYWILESNELVRLRPDWVQIVLQERVLPDGQPIGWKKIGYAYHHRGISASSEPTFLTLDEVAHFAPSPDPEASYRGQSWISSIIPELQGDKTMQRHKQKFLENGATPNMVVSMDKAVSWDNFQKFKATMEKDHRGTENAYKTMYLGAGADVKVVGADMQGLNFKELQGHGETRIAAAAGVPPIIVGLSEGLESATYSNYGQARRRFADATMHPLWQNLAGSLGILLDKPAPRNGVRLWYDARDVPFLREDEKDAADIQGRQADTIARLIDAGYKPDTVVAAVDASDFSALEHTGLFSVQLQPPGSTAPPVAPVPAVPTPDPKTLVPTKGPPKTKAIGAAK